jgi:rod shape-determining protein MreD
VRALISFVVVAVTVVVQLTIVDRIAFPGGAGPDLVLLVVAALALAGGPLAGVLTGFAAGLALDVAPPGSHFTGQDALVFCLIGYLCGLLADQSSGDSAEQGHTALFEIVVTAAGAVCGEALVALLGVMLSDPRVTWPAITHVLPAAVAYDVLLCPFVLYAAAASLRLGGVRPQPRRAGWSASQARTAAPVTSQGAIRQLAGGSGPRLRLSERDRSPGSIGGVRGPGAGRPVPRREPQLKLGRTGLRTSGAASFGAAFAPSGLGAGPVKVRFGGRRREGALGGSMLGARPAGATLRGAGLGSGARFGSSNMGRSLLGGSVFSRSSQWGTGLGRSSRPGRAAAFGRSAPLGLASPLRHRGKLMRSPGGGSAARTPRFARGSSLGRLSGVLRRSAGPRSPGRGWLRGASARRPSLGTRSPRGKFPRGTSLGGRSPRRGTFGSGRLGRSTLGRSTLGRGTLGRGTPRLTPRPRLRIPRLRARRGWRAGGYR